ncbi:probable carboxylesterase 15 [Phtheirospermum japonicum]|uniref:Probable carboxylesterase 15 n=1 Tax=Phtheirospermum japonicum TaxID=374723 RepID=A0A830DI78_9LAMI|nr:probable carboxylesterase 15 [Phtheirospermum japonicum]
MKVEDDGSAVWNDCLYDENNNLHLRLYKPCSPPAATKLPVLYFFHGGGFCLGSRTWPHMYSCCLRLASALQVLVVAPDYHLAPGQQAPRRPGRRHELRPVAPEPGGVRRRRRRVAAGRER